MDAVNIIFEDGKAVYHSTTFEDAREAGAQIIHWVPEDE